MAFVVLPAASVLAVACGGSGSSASPTARPTSAPAGGVGSSTPLAAKSTPAPATAAASQSDVSVSGDIPDNQVFVIYHSSTAGYSLSVPEGWARTESGLNVTFTDKFNSVSVDIKTASSAPSVSSARSTEVPALQAMAKGFQEVETASVDVGGTQVVRIRYRADSPADVVTGKTLTLDTDRYLFYSNGHVAAVSLSAPVGADNVDAWNQMARSFKWD